MAIPNIIHTASSSNRGFKMADVYRLSDYERKPDKEPPKKSVVVALPEKRIKLDDSELIPLSMLRDMQ